MCNTFCRCRQVLINITEYKLSFLPGISEFPTIVFNGHNVFAIILDSNRKITL